MRHMSSSSTMSTVPSRTLHCSSVCMHMSPMPFPSRLHHRQPSWRKSPSLPHARPVLETERTAAAANTAIIDAKLLTLRNQYQVGLQDHLDEHMGLCRDVLIEWMADVTRQKAQDRRELAAERAEIMVEVDRLRAAVTADRAELAWHRAELEAKNTP